MQYSSFPQEIKDSFEQWYRTNRTVPYNREFCQKCFVRGYKMAALRVAKDIIEQIANDLKVAMEQTDLDLQKSLTELEDLYEKDQETASD